MPSAPQTSTRTSGLDRCPACFRKIKRSNPANALYWTLLHQLADNLKPGGVAYSADQFHAYYKSRFLGCQDIAMPNGKTLTIPNSTAHLDVAEFGDYFDKVQADAAERGVYLADLETA